MPNQSQHILISGGTGLVGRHLSKKLLNRGYSVKILSRSEGETNGVKHVTWDIKQREINVQAIKNCNHIIHLAGANISGERWTDERKQVIIDSRVEGTKFLSQMISEHNPDLSSFVSASGVGYYGQQTSEKIFSEAHAPGDDFLGRCCQLWEKSTQEIKEQGIRTVMLRTGVVLASKDSALQKIMQPVAWNLGAPLGNGKQYMPWIHLDDLCNAYIAAIENKSMSGAYNVASWPCPSNEELTHILSNKMDKKLWLPNVPAFVLRLALGEMADVLLKGSRVSNSKLLETGFRFEYPNLDGALMDLI